MLTVALPDPEDMTGGMPDVLVVEVLVVEVFPPLEVVVVVVVVVVDPPLTTVVDVEDPFPAFALSELPVPIIITEELS